ncbi:phBC6A51 family helix-turn-helix protein [Lactobacillus helveticus]|uniref:phBC6A51 family helix-turn-helix protein n=1 Tax=Lactobacillus helveticus TaxID=1587 RepID=UPI0021A83A7F|nr:phBC6A51 family helix-turn-helix protein [Lactobacillus helveticus]MCT3400948.1 helix-turn-helix domain-containing protein [Lactobacillus helveticus]MCT3415488.1 helix-turn-helix domain-containing protein [Lactobacillus helveticus]
MSSVHKSSDLRAFSKLTKKRQKAVIMLFENDKTIEEIAKILNITDRAVYKWKRNPDFIQAQQEYAIFVLNTALPDSISELIKLIRNSKSDMVKLQAIQTVLKHANLLSDNSTPELDKAKIRKANADARVAEARAKAMEDNGADVELLLDKMMDTLAKEDLKHGSK